MPIYLCPESLAESVSSPRTDLVDSARSVQGQLADFARSVQGRLSHSTRSVLGLLVDFAKSVQESVGGLCQLSPIQTIQELIKFSKESLVARHPFQVPIVSLAKKN